MAQAPASSDWQELVDPDEARRHREFSEYLTKLQTGLNRKFGPGRALHRKQVLALSGSLRILGRIPKYAAQGLFASRGIHPVVIRLSNGSPSIQRDSIPDVRGFALSVRGVSGPGALLDVTDRQDFLLINRSSFGFRDSQDFAAFVEAAGTRDLAHSRSLLSRYASPSGALSLARITRDSLRPFAGFAATTFYSAAPIQIGTHAARVRLVPATKQRTLTERAGWAHSMAHHVTKSELQYYLFLDFYTDETLTPIEDASRAWPIDKIPSIHIGTLTIDRQDPDSSDGQSLAQSVEADHFDPWQALADHRPLGEVMRARKVAYYASQQNRSIPTN